MEAAIGRSVFGGIEVFLLPGRVRILIDIEALQRLRRLVPELPAKRS